VAKFVLTSENDQGGYIWVVYIQKDLWSFLDSHMMRYQSEERALHMAKMFVEDGWFVQFFKMVGYSTHGKETTEIVEIVG
jgi:hypothetical protein